ncbi:YdcF family protein [Corynebacterium nasicanis]
MLGTAQYDGTPSRQFAARLDHALTLWNAGAARHVYTLGGKLPGDRFTEAQVGRSYLVDRGVPAGAVTEVAQGNDTVGSYRGLVDKHEPGRVIVVTDPHHALRAEILARQAGMEAVASPTQTSPTRWPAAAWWRTLVHEVGGMLVVDVSRVLGRYWADRLETLLRGVEAGLRPSRRARHDALAGE